MNRIRRHRQAVALALLCGLPLAQAQPADYPSRPIRILATWGAERAPVYPKIATLNERMGALREQGSK